MKICLLLALLPLLFPYHALAQTLPVPPKLTTQPPYVSRFAFAASNPVTVAAVWPTPTPTQMPTRRATLTQVKTSPTRAISTGNCVATLKQAGLLPSGPVTKDGFARTIPVKPLDLAEGEKAVIKTREGSVGHVLQVVKKDGNLISTVEGGYKNGVGRVVNPAVVAGEVAL